MDLVIRRFCLANFGTFGEMMVAGCLLYTVERPWLENRPLISCIPEGSYACQPRMFFRGNYPAIEVTGVPDRTYILFHKANLPEQLGGCIAPAIDLGCHHDKWAGLGSGAAFQLLMEEYGDREFELTINSNQQGPGDGV